MRCSFRGVPLCSCLVPKHDFRQARLIEDAVSGATADAGYNNLSAILRRVGIPSIYCWR